MNVVLGVVDRPPVGDAGATAISVVRTGEP